MKLISTLLLLHIFFTGFAQSDRAGSVAARKTVDSLMKEMEKVFNENDMMKVAAFYADDAEISGDNYSVKGRANLNNYWSSLKDKGRGWKIEVVETGGTGDLIYQLGKSDLKHLSGTRPDPVSSVTNFIVIWKLQPDGSYKILKDYLTRAEFKKPGN
jgi:ketosteroid isomerase-like protein